LQINLQLKPQEKPKPIDFPKSDPTAVFLPLMDSYAAAGRVHHLNDPRLSPYVAKLETLPTDILMLVPTVDILVHEQLTFIERLKAESKTTQAHRGRRFEALLLEDGFHGVFECKLSDSVSIYC
jgi:hypothetical protein